MTFKKTLNDHVLSTAPVEPLLLSPAAYGVEVVEEMGQRLPPFRLQQAAVALETMDFGVVAQPRKRMVDAILLRMLDETIPPSRPGM